MSALGDLTDFQDWVGFGNAGFVQSAFNVAYFNMQSFYWNVYMRQMQKYQQKNYSILWTYIARRDILNMMGITVQRMSNYMVASAILFTVAAIVALSAKFLQQNHPFADQLDKFIMLAFYSCMVAANVLFIAAIIIAVEGQNLAITETMKLLTFKLRPENPADYNHDYMKQAQWIEKLGLFSLFRIPGLMPNYEQSLREMFGEDPAPSVAAAPAKKLRLEDITALENCDIKTTHAAYVAKFAEFARLWVCFDEYSKYCVGVASIELAQGLLCWVLGWFLANQYQWHQIAGACWTFLLTCLLCIFLGHFKVFESSARFLLYGTIVCFNCLIAVSVSVPSGTVKEVAYPLCFAVHCVMYSTILYLGYYDERVLAEQPTIKRSYWNSNEKWYGRGLLSDSHDESRDSEDDRLEHPSRDLDNNPVGTDETIGDVEKRTFGSFKELEARVHTNISFLRRTLRTILAGFVLLWLGLTLGSAHYAWTLHTDEYGSLSSTLHAQNHENFTVAHTQYLLLTAIACAENKTFASNGYKIFQMWKNSWTEYPCHQHGEILDIVTSCDTQDCWPVVLMRAEGNSSNLLDCKTGEIMQFLQEATFASHAVVKYESSPEEGLKRQKLIGEHAGKVIQYRWSSELAGWQPEWKLVRDRSFWSNGQGTTQIVALSTSRKHLTVLSNAEPGHPAIKRYDLGSMEFSDQWTLDMPVVGGCVLDQNGRDMMMLLGKDDKRRGTPDLMRISMDSKT